MNRVISRINAQSQGNNLKRVPNHQSRPTDPPTPPIICHQITSWQKLSAIGVIKKGTTRLIVPVLVKMVNPKITRQEANQKQLSNPDLPNRRSKTKDLFNRESGLQDKVQETKAFQWMKKDKDQESKNLVKNAGFKADIQRIPHARHLRKTSRILIFCEFCFQVFKTNFV